MKIYFAASVKGYSYYDNEYSAIEKALKEQKQTLITTSFKKDEVKKFYNQLEKGGSKAYSDYFIKTVNTIKISDINVFECTVPSLGIGFQVEKSLELNKPIIILYLSGHIPHFFAGTDSEKIILREYNLQTINKVISSSINFARNLVDKRFNFFINPTLLTYLESASKKEGITKSGFIRNLIINHMKRMKK